MMKLKTFVILFLIIGFVSLASSQEVYTNEKYGFSVQGPKGWSVINYKDISVDLRKSHGQQFITYYKNPNNTEEQINPTILIFVVANRFKSIEDFNKKITRRRFNKNLEDYNVKKRPSLINIDGKYGAYEIATYTFINKNNDYLKVWRRSYAFPTKDYLFYISFVDKKDSEENTAIFKSLIQSIKLPK